MRGPHVLEQVVPAAQLHLSPCPDTAQTAPVEHNGSGLPWPLTSALASMAASPRIRTRPARWRIVGDSEDGRLLSGISKLLVGIMAGPLLVVLARPRGT